jgi:SUMO ligase MMS21 Smc5/6 complex component
MLNAYSFRKNFYPRETWKKCCILLKAESSDDDLIVVKTEYNTVDPITKKEIVDPVRNKRCNHVYERSTIYSMIDLARLDPTNSW